jgi:predicted TPR repeat methyltransferase
MSKKDASTRPAIETITPLSAPGIKGHGADPSPRNKGPWNTLLILLGALVLLVIGGGWLLYYLSQNPLQPDRVAGDPLPAPVAVRPIPVEPQPKQPAPAAAAENLAIEKEAAEQKLADFLAARNKLDGKGVANWGEPSYIEMINLGRAADAAFMNKDYKAAAEQYGRATSVADDLVGRSPEVLIRLLDEGQVALEAGTGDLALKTFATALKIDPANDVALRGLRRSKTIEAVSALIASGKQHEADGNLPLAAAEYQKALQLDADAQAARTALDTVNARIEEARFQQLLSEGLAAFHNHNYQTARNKLIKAKSLKPNSIEVADALSQVDQAIRLARIDQLQKQARTAEQIEDWQKALSAYQAVLKIDRNVQFATRGEIRAAEQIRIAKRLDFYLAQPDTLESDSQLKNASLLLGEARDVEPQGPKLAARIKELDRIVSIARTPVKVTIESDNFTHVAVYRIGKLGRFEVRELELRPGTYTVVGARDGYQDVRQKLVVKPGRQPIRLTVKCKVKI